jgi:hypothetical protein
MDMPRTPATNTDAAVVVTLVVVATMVVVMVVVVGEEAKLIASLMMLCEVACGWEDWGLMEGPVLAK